ncbi:hypothetical protein [Burkholderia contaminans]|uniref:hypothetical protein n=1 Tax=Burkholderia contaminans TaxID=488447 RepID=UPI0012602891|nr:hypothetical protein [Burkholderia contaminans]
MGDRLSDPPTHLWRHVNPAGRFCHWDNSENIKVQYLKNSVGLFRKWMMRAIFRLPRYAKQSIKMFRRSLTVCYRDKADMPPVHLDRDQRTCLTITTAGFSIPWRPPGFRKTNPRIDYNIASIFQSSSRKLKQCRGIYPYSPEFQILNT